MNLLKQLSFKTVISSIVGLVSAPVIKSIQEAANRQLVQGWICVPYTTDSTPCFSKMVGNALFCLERHDWLDSFKPIFETLGTFAHSMPARAFRYFGSNPVASLPFSLIPFAIAEEIFTRGCIQNGLLRALPKKVIEWIAPNKSLWIDHAVARSARIVISAGVFALLHTRKWECSAGGGLAEFLSGLVYSTIGEFSVVGASAAHASANLLHYAQGARMAGWD